MIHRILLAGFTIALPLFMQAQALVQNFSLTNVVDGNIVSLESYPSSSGIAIIFTSNVCPYDLYYAERIKSLVFEYQGRIQFILINAHLEAGESPDKMKEAYGNWGLPIPYLVDKEQTAMAYLGAKKSPEVFLLRRAGGKYKVFYSGAIDDNPQVPTAVTDSYFKKAIDTLLAGNDENTSSVRAVGCSIRRK